MAQVRYPTLYQVNTRVWLTAISAAIGRRATLDDIPDASLDEWARQGFDWIWLLSVWQTGAAAQSISRSNPEWRGEFEETLHDLKEHDISGSGFAIQSYTVHQDMGGRSALVRLRNRMHKRGLKLMLDFVPNHVAPDHEWLLQEQNFFISGTETDLLKEPHNYCRVGPKIFAHGRDPYFPGWPDTIQLDYGSKALQLAMLGELLSIAGQCDGLRCDMAMLILPDVFQRTWGMEIEPFWPMAIEATRTKHPGFEFMAEVYWGLEWTMQQQGFNFTYDKKLYDRLRERDAASILAHFSAGLDYQDKLVRFLENHDEPRAAAAFSQEMQKAAALIAYLAPGLRFFHQGQFEGYPTRISPHLVRGPTAVVDGEIKQFYEQLLAVLRDDILRNGSWRQSACTPAWEGNASNSDFIACCWEGHAAERLLVAVNYSPNQGQCYVRFTPEAFSNGRWRLSDRMSDAVYERDGEELNVRGLYLDLSPWHYHVFQFARL